MPTVPHRLEAPGLLSGLLFFAVVIVGCAYIVFSKLLSLGAVYVTLVPVCIMVAYASLLGLARLFRLRDDQSGDNLYYMGFLFTLTSLAVSLYQFSEAGSADQIVQNFGIAIASTIAGIALRIFFNQMRRDPIEVEQTARLELADASRRVKRELESTVLEFGYFRRAAQQSLGDALEEIVAALTSAKEKFVLQLDEFAKTSSKPLEDASKKSGEAIDELVSRISEALADVAHGMADETEKVSKGVTVMVKSLEGVAAKLEAMQTPDQIIEIKLSPMIQGLTRAVNTFAKNADAQAKSVDANIEQMQSLATAMIEFLAEIRGAENAAAPVSSGVGAPTVVESGAGAPVVSKGLGGVLETERQS